MLKQSVIDNMKEIAEHCMGEEIASCVATCPMHTNVKEYVRLIREGKGEEAIKVIRDQLFLPGTLGRICAHPCEGKCKWNEGKSPMAIASLKDMQQIILTEKKTGIFPVRTKMGKK